MKTQNYIFLLLLCLSKPIIAFSQSSQEAHMHGEGHITLVFDNKHLLLEISTAAVNILGFEHKPNTAEQWQLLHKLKKQLAKPEQFIMLLPKCKLKSSRVNLPYQHIDTEHNNTHTNIHKKTAHNHAHQNTQHSYSSDSNHTDISIRYEWRCNETTLPLITFNYFTYYPAFKKITLQWVTAQSQGETHLYKTKNKFNIQQQ